jgi:transposase InsO family protein
VNRSTVYYKPITGPHKGKGKTPEHSDEAVLAEIKRVLKEIEKMGFHGEGYKKVHRRLSIKSGKERVRRIMAENNLLCPQRNRGPRGPKVHDGTIIPLAPNMMWGTDMTTGHTSEEGKAHVWALIDHYTGECLGIHASKGANRYEAMEPLNQAVSEVFQDHEKDVAKGILLRHDHGSQYMSRDFKKQVKHFGMVSSPSFVRTPEGNGVVERFFKTLKENCLWIESFTNIEEMRQRLLNFKRDYNQNWIMHRHNYKTPRQVRENWINETSTQAA